MSNDKDIRIQKGYALYQAYTVRIASFRLEKMDIEISKPK
jgi:hypothetical protein